ncbi:hypothetical protein DUNSADRAFT_8353 [Dunaliella salina]|uniref:Encoded protein n=1 Tax=Dunaliella salina TaxID=3046 RepID=A0ABQ7GJR8_DUNSA|nr:hypothetical protein DUNSADRAFT_8353 [Dunaliella salina]|eukprot:KAF5834852.1 hypothetical protein DUNSADRAFT_8353 [Dunaliella salina]
MATTKVGRPLEGPGKLAIAECSLEGGSVAIQCLGTGSLASVRVIYRARHKSYFLGVDCQVPGVQQPRPHMLQAASSKERATEGKHPLHQSNQLLATVQGVPCTAAGIAALARLFQSRSVSTMAEPAIPVIPDISQAEQGDVSESGQVLESVRLGLHEVPHRGRERYKF